MKIVKIAALGAAVGLVAASGAFAKAHNQGNTEVPGQNVGTETIPTSQALGGLKGKRPADKGPTESPALEKAGR